MNRSFAKDDFPGKPRILFVGLPQSTHTHGWISLLEDQEVNVRLFALPTGDLPAETKVKAYLTLPGPAGTNNTRMRFYLPGRLGRLQKKIAARIGLAGDEKNLARVVRSWRPDVIHTLGVDPASFFYLTARERYHLEKIGQWVVQIRGGSDLTLSRHVGESIKKLKRVFVACDQIVSDNLANIGTLSNWHIPRSKFAAIVPVPGSGGIDFRTLPKNLAAPSRRRRIIVWPKAYECQWSKALPVLAAIQSVWEKIAPCEVHLLAVGRDVHQWVLALPLEIRRHCRLYPRVRQTELFSLLKRARIMLAPSLVDGVPNSLYEAMACGAFPIVSPLETIRPIVAEEKNVLYARNLYPDEIAAALVRAMNHDALVDRAAANNRKLVKRLADREMIRKKVVDYYQTIISSGRRGG